MGEHDQHFKRLLRTFFTPFLDSVSDLLSEAGLCVAVSDVPATTAVALAEPGRATTR
jgi:hypothetical protein